MKKQFKIAIYSGAIPSTTFIENLIEGVAKTHQVYLFGSKRGVVDYDSKNIKKVYIYDSKLRSLLTTFYRLVLLLFTSQKRFNIAFRNVKQYNSRYEKFRQFSKIVGVLLYLPDVFHIQWAKDLEHWLFLKDELGVKIVLSLRGAHINYSPIKDKALATSYKSNFPKVDAFHAVSKDIALEAEKYNAAPNKIEVIHSILDQKMLLCKTNLFQKTDPLRILSVGRFHWVKGYRYALDAIKDLKEKGVPANYTIIAAGKISEEILFQIHQLELKDDVEIINGLSQEDVFNMMKSSDCLLLPSLNEGIANVVLEAMAIGLPVISTDCGGMAEVIRHKETGWLVPVRDAEAMSSTILNFKESSEETINEVMEKAKALIASDFDPKDNIQKMHALYQGVIKN